MIPSPNMESIFHNAPVLITGGLGFIGSNLARRLVTLGAKVRILDCLVPEQGGSKFNIKDISAHVQVVEGDLRNSETLEDSLGEPEYIFNLAGQSSHWDSMVDPHMDLEINCHAQLNLLEVLRSRHSSAKVVLASTRQIYGYPTYLPVDEKHLLNPVDINGIHRNATEQYHLLYSKIYGLRSVILRLTNTIGPRMRVKDARQTFAGLWIRLAIERVPFKVWGGDQLRDFNYVDDVVDALLMAAVSDQESGRVYNLGASPALTLKQFAELLQEITGCEYVIEAFPEDRKSIDIGDYYASYDRIRREIGWEPKTSIRKAVERTVDYYKEHLKYYV